VSASSYEVTLELPASSCLPTIHNKWERGRWAEISATYTKDELALCMWLGDIWNKPEFAGRPRGR
jgi:hypothetical protein